MHANENINMSKLAIDLGVPRMTLINLHKSKDKIISEFEAGRNCEQKRKQKLGFDDIDEPLLKWYCNTRNERIPVSGEMLLLKARQFASVCGHDNADKLDINWINTTGNHKKLHARSYTAKQHLLMN